MQHKNLEINILKKDKTWIFKKIFVNIEARTEVLEAAPDLNNVIFWFSSLFDQQKLIFYTDNMWRSWSKAFLITFKWFANFSLYNKSQTLKITNVKVYYGASLTLLGLFLMNFAEPVALEIDPCENWEFKLSFDVWKLSRLEDNKWSLR